MAEKRNRDMNVKTEVAQHYGCKINDKRLPDKDRVSLMEYLLQTKYGQLESIALDGECNTFVVICARLLLELHLKEFFEVYNELKNN